MPKNKELIQTQKQVSAYEKKVVHQVFRDTIEFTEKYIEIIYSKEYPDWQKRKQIHDDSIKRPDANDPNEIEKLFTGALFGFKMISGDKPQFIRDELKEKFYKWISATGIDINNCPPRLKHYLFEISEILEGRGDKLVDDVKNRDRSGEIDPNSPEYGKIMNELIFNIHSPLENARNEYSSLEGKTHKDIKAEDNFTGDGEPAERSFKQMAGQHDYQGFNFFPQKGKQSASSSGIHPTNLNEVVQDVKTNPQNWTLDEIATEINNFGWAKKQEPVVYCRHAQLDNYDQQGKLNFNNNPIYRWESFNVQQRFEIKQAKNISGDYLTNEEIKWVVREVKENPRVWRIGEIDKQTYLIHNSAQIKRDEIGTLIHGRQKFSDLEWVEINKALERVKLIEDIKRNAGLERDLVVLNQETGEYYEKDDWFIHNSLERKIDDKTGCLIFDASLMIRAKDLTEAEQKEVGYKLETSHQVQSQNRPSGGKGGYGSSIMYGSIAVISLIGLAFTR